MAKTHASTLTATYTGKRYSVAATDRLNVLTDTITLKQLTSFTVGTGALQANAIYDAVRTLAVSATETLVLSDGSLQNTALEPLQLTGVKRIIIENRGTDSSLVVGGAASHAFYAGFLDSSTTKVTIGPGGRMVWDSPTVAAAVTSGVADQLKFAHLGDGTAGLSYAIVIEGTDPG